MPLRIAFQGERCRVFFGEDSRGNALAEGFLKGLDRTDTNSMMHRITWHGNQGPSSNTTQYEVVKNHPGIYEVKARKNRLLGFELEGHALVLTNGYKKSAPRTEIERAYAKAEAIRQEIMEEMRHG